MNDRVTVEIENHVAEVTLNRPEKHNAVDLAMFEALIDAGDDLAHNADIRAVVLRGAGDNFCAGIDLSVFRASVSPVSISVSNMARSTALCFSGRLSVTSAT